MSKTQPEPGKFYDPETHQWVETDTQQEAAQDAGTEATTEPKE
jgi:hypothetical protein